jgi:hypothetical protein
MKKIFLIFSLILAVNKTCCQTTFYDNSTKLYGIIDKTGKIIINPKYKYMSSILDGISIYSNEDNSKNRKYGLLDEKGNIILLATYNSIRRNMEGNFIYSTGKNYGLLDKKGKTLLKPIFHSPCCLDNSMLSEGLIQFNEIEYLTRDSLSYNYHYGYYNKLGNIVIKPQFTNVSNFFNGKAIVSKYSIDDFKETYNIINTKGEVLNPTWIEDSSKLYKDTNYQDVYPSDVKLLDYIWVNNYKTGDYKKIQGKHYNVKLDRAFYCQDVYKGDGSAYLINGKAEIISKIEYKGEYVPYCWDYFINGLMTFQTKNKEWDGEIEVYKYKSYIIDVNGNIIKSFDNKIDNLINSCDEGNH